MLEERAEELEIGKLMSAYNAKGELLEFKLRESKSKYIGQALKCIDESYIRVLGNTDIARKGSHFPFFLIEFDEGTRLVVSEPVLSSISHKKLSNPNKPSLCGVGCKGQGRFIPSRYKKEYDLWGNMIERCLKSDRYPSYIGCTIEPRWLCFQIFCGDISHLENYRQWKENTTSQAWALDKDIKVKGNKVYSRDACMFVTKSENSKQAIAFKLEQTLIHPFLATNIETGEMIVFYNKSRFARAYGLSTRHLQSCLKEDRNKHKGWTFKNITPNEAKDLLDTKKATLYND